MCYSRTALIFLAITLLNCSVNSHSNKHDKEENPNFEECLKLLAKLSIDAQTVTVLIASHSYIMMLPVAYRLVKNIGRGLWCFKNHSHEVNKRARETSLCAFRSLSEAKDIMNSFVSDSFLNKTLNYWNLGERLSEVVQRTSRCISGSNTDK